MRKLKASGGYDYELDPNPDAPSRTAGPIPHLLTDPAWHVFGRRDSGYDCGNSANCIQADGSGYMIPSEYQIGHEAATTNPHNFHTVVPTQQCDRYFSNGECAHSIEYGYVLNPIWVRSPEPWGMRPSLEWLASTASVRAPALLL